MSSLTSYIFISCFFFFFNDTATTEIYTLSLHDALPIGLAQVQELHAAIREFGGSGKLTVAWAETFGDFSPGNVPYYLATAFERIYLQPSGDLGLTGIAVQNWFYRGALDKLGVEFQVGARGEYKS